MILFHEKRRNYFHKTIILSVFLAAILISACSFSGTSTPLSDATSTPASETSTEDILATETPAAQGSSVIKFPDGSEITLYTGAQIDIITILDLAPDVSAHAITLQKGHIIVSSQLPDGIWFSVLNPLSYVVVVTGSIMELEFDPESGFYLLDCIEGTCKMGTDNEHLFDVLEGQQACMDEAGNFFGPFDDIAFEDLSDLCQNSISIEPPTSVAETSTATPDIRASATAACSDFEDDFPGTPCP